MVDERVQHRLAAILAADVVGYSRLMERDEAGTFTMLEARRKDVPEPAVVRHQGRIFKVKRKFDSGFDELGPQAIKNLVDPVHVHRVRAADRRTAGRAVAAGCQTADNGVRQGATRCTTKPSPSSGAALSRC